MARQSRRKVSRRPPPHRYLLAFFALAMAVAQLFGVGHLVLVSHAVCEHGALFHGTAAEVRHGGEAHAAAVPRGVSSARPGGAGEGEHQHCDPFGVLPGVVAVAPACDLPAAVESAQLPPTPVARAAFAPIGLLALAPKSSPPRASSPDV
jgi:hypothetical protein